MPYFVYIIECSNKALYTGITTDINRRFNEHKTGRGGHYTSYNPAVRIRYSETYKTRSEALKREAQIKRWSRTKKLALIKGQKGILKGTSRCRNRFGRLNPLAPLKEIRSKRDHEEGEKGAERKVI